ncbi:MAG: endonuclease MutS2 [Eubacteriales bacterium]
MININDFGKALKTLEYNKVLDLLTECAATDGARLRISTLVPSRDMNQVRKLQAQTSDAKRLASYKGSPSFGGVKDITQSVERAVKDAVLTPGELLDIAHLCAKVRGLLDYHKVNNTLRTVLDEIFERLYSNKFLEDKISRCIVSEDMIADEASPALSDIRRKMRAANNRVKENLQKYITGGTYSKFLQENLVTMRGGRYVIPVKSEYRSEIKGLVHDTSSSGSTLFIEPMNVVEANNEIRMLEKDEEKEIERILSELSADVASFSENLLLDYLNITELAIIFAKSELSFRLMGCEPVISEKREIDLVRARHPLLDKKKIVPINISLGAQYDTLVITGPNTGGKTVSLKTLGLLCLMSQAGLHIPADDSSVICVFDEILPDIGDEQSIEQSLSTFSSHMTNIIRILDIATPRSLILFDELGAGTDPVEGAALAMAILEKVRRIGALCAATTHYAELNGLRPRNSGSVQCVLRV